MYKAVESGFTGVIKRIHPRIDDSGQSDRRRYDMYEFLRSNIPKFSALIH